MLTVMAATVSALGLGACVTSIAYTSRVEQAYPASGTLVPVEGHSVHVLKQGSAGPVVLMIHGASANAREFTWTLAPRLDTAPHFDHNWVLADRGVAGKLPVFRGMAQSPCGACA